MSFQSRKRWARISFGLLITSLVSTAWVQTMPMQGWVAGTALLSLLFSRGLWRCPQCRLPLSAIPLKEIHQCRHCGETLD
jgi:hypothetical protein